MILINLLPPELRPIKRTPLPYLVSMLMLALAVAVIGYLYVAQQTKIAAVEKQSLASERELDQLKDIVEEYNQLSEQKIGLQERIVTIKEILSDRIIWSKKLHRLAELTPKNFWYSSIKVATKTAKERRRQIDPKTKKPTGKMESITVKRPVLELAGYAIEDETGEVKITQLAVSTEEDEEFSRMFTLGPYGLEDTEFHGYRVRGFTLEYYIASTSAEDSGGGK